MSLPVIAIFDIGRTNKKLFLFDEECRGPLSLEISRDE